jgi:hypothetical protein
MRGRAALAAALLVTPLLTGCGGGGKGYCQTVGDHESEIASTMRSDPRTGALALLPAFEDLRDAAPDDVADDWQLLVTRVTALRDALDDAGVEPTSYDPAHPPSGLTSEERARIRRVAAQLAAPDTVQALGTVQQEVLDVCHEPLEL